MVTAFLIQPQVFNTVIQRRPEWTALSLCSLGVSPMPYVCRTPSCEYVQNITGRKGCRNVWWPLSDAQLVLSIIHMTVHMMPCETDFPATVVYGILQVKVYLSWNIDCQTLSYLSLIFHIVAWLYWFFLMINCGRCKQKYSNHGLTAHVFHDCAATIMRNGR